MIPPFKPKASWEKDHPSLCLAQERILGPVLSRVGWVESRISQPLHDRHLLQGLSCALQDLEPHPWPLATRF